LKDFHNELDVLISEGVLGKADLQFVDKTEYVSHGKGYLLGTFDSCCEIIEDLKDCSQDFKNISGVVFEETGELSITASKEDLSSKKRNCFPNLEHL
jgi:hypothetical protein